MLPPGIDVSRITPVAAVRPQPARDPARAVVAAAQGHRARDRSGRGPRRRPRDRRGAPPRRGVRALPERRHRRRPAQRRAGTGCSRSSAWRSASRSSRTSTTRPCGAPRRRSERPSRSCPPRPRRSASSFARSSTTPPSATAQRGGVASVRRARPRPGADHRPPARRLRSTLMALSGQLKRLGKHSAIYGLGGLVSRILAVLLLPLYTHYLSTVRLRPDRDADRARHRAHDRAAVRDLVGVLPLLLRRRRRRRPPARPADVVLVHDDDGDARADRPRRLRESDLQLALRRPERREPRPRERGRALGAAELHAADEPVPRRGALRRVRDREPLEHPAHGRHDAPARRRARQGPARRHRRQLHGHADRLPRAPRLPARAARAPAQLAAAPQDEPLRTAARPLGAAALGDELQRPVLPRQADRHLGGRPLLRRRPRRVRDGAPADRVQDRLARVRVLDQERRRGQADLRLGAHLPRRDLHLDRDRADAALAVARGLADDAASSRAPHASSGRSRSRRSRSAATSCSRSASAVPAAPSSTG